MNLSKRIIPSHYCIIFCVFRFFFLPKCCQCGYDDCDMRIEKGNEEKKPPNVIMTMWMHVQLIGAMWWHFCQWFFFVLDSFVCIKYNTQWIPMTFSRFLYHSSHSGWQHIQIYKLYIINSKCYFYRNDCEWKSKQFPA